MPSTDTASILRLQRLHDRNAHTCSAGVGILRGPGTDNWDIGLNKHFRLFGEGCYVQFRTELFDAAVTQVDSKFGAFRSACRRGSFGSRRRSCSDIASPRRRHWHRADLGVGKIEPSLVGIRPLVIELIEFVLVLQ